MPHCVYLLRSDISDDKFYVGYSPDPFHRLRQHNGHIRGGARYTSRYKPWSIHTVVGGFATSVDALKFEWALQNPWKSKWFKYIPPKHRRARFCKYFTERQILMRELARNWHKKPAPLFVAEGIYGQESDPETEEDQRDVSELLCSSRLE